MGILDAPAKQRRQGLFGGLSVVAQRGNPLTNNGQSNGTDTTATYRYGHKITSSCYDVRLVYGNYVGNGVTVSDGPNAITVKASIEPVVNAVVGSGAAGSVWPVTFNGAQTATIQPGGFVVSDPVPLSAVAGQFMYTRTNVSVTAGGKWTLSQYVGGGDRTYQDGFTIGSDITGTGAITGSTFGAGYGPVAILGILAAGVSDPKTVLIVGDSKAYGSGNTTQDQSYLVQACQNAALAWVNIARASELASGFSGTARRQRMPLAAGCSHAIVEYGINDINGGATLATVQASLLSIWTDLAARRLRVYQTTVEPVTTSTDGWLTTANQTTTSGNTVRVNLNNWLRAGAPIDPVTKAAVAVGTSGVLIAGVSGHPLAVCSAYPYGCIEVADLIESARDSGKWKPAGRVVADAAITSGTVTLTSATAAFTSADVGQSVRVAGAGAAGATLSTTIASVTNATTAVLTGAPAGTTVSAASLAIGVYTADGTHPTTTGHGVIGAGINLAALS